MMDVIVVVGAGSLGQAIARRVSAGFDASATTVDVASRPSVDAFVARAEGFGAVTGLIQAAGVSPSQAPIEAILKVDLYGTALLLETFGGVMASAARASCYPRSPATGWDR